MFYNTLDKNYKKYYSVGLPHIMLLSVPRPISMMIPVMPLMLSTQPGNGSATAPVTIDGRTIVMGSLW